jgi:hypothetical protein
MNACQQASVQAVVSAVQPARQVLQLAVSQAVTGTGTATRIPRSPIEVTSRRARVLTAHVQSIAPPIGVAVLRAHCSQRRSGRLSALGSAKDRCKRRAVVPDLGSLFPGIATGGDQEDLPSFVELKPHLEWHTHASFPPPGEVTHRHRRKPRLLMVVRAPFRDGLPRGIRNALLHLDAGWGSAKFPYRSAPFADEVQHEA